jgi:hypothetical protein
MMTDDEISPTANLPRWLSQTVPYQRMWGRSYRDRQPASSHNTQLDGLRRKHNRVSKLRQRRTAIDPLKDYKRGK